MWSELFLETDIDIPVLLRNILEFNGFDSKALLASFLNDDQLKKIENFMRESHSLIDDSEKIHFYGIFRKQPHKFLLLEGNISFTT